MAASDGLLPSCRTYRTRSELETILLRHQTVDELFVAVALVELDLQDTAVILGAHHGICQSLGGEGLADARGPFQNQVLLPAEEFFHIIQIVPSAEDLRNESPLLFIGKARYLDDGPVRKVMLGLLLVFEKEHVEIGLTVAKLCKLLILPYFS